MRIIRFSSSLKFLNLGILYIERRMRGLVFKLRHFSLHIGVNLITDTFLHNTGVISNETIFFFFVDSRSIL